MPSPSDIARATLIAALCWQAAGASRALWTSARDQGEVCAGELLGLSSDDRLRRTLGADADVLFALRAVLPPDAIVLTRELVDMRESALVQSLRHTLYPVWLAEVPLAALAGPLPTGHGRPVFLLDLDAAPQPPGDRWTEPRAVGRLRLYRYRAG
ncbi:MAG: hypothetical protein IPM29_05840 [Planctomycetes bacterium]|nr:hypothetical protein [Planctomycetota bacterium]